MRRSRFSEGQIIAVLKEHEAGMKTQDVCRKHGISDATLHKWKAKYGGMTASERRQTASTTPGSLCIRSEIVLARLA